MILSPGHTSVGSLVKAGESINPSGQYPARLRQSKDVLQGFLDFLRNKMRFDATIRLAGSQA